MIPMSEHIQTAVRFDGFTMIARQVLGELSSNPVNCSRNYEIAGRLDEPVDRVDEVLARLCLAGLVESCYPDCWSLVTPPGGDAA